MMYTIQTIKWTQSAQASVIKLVYNALTLIGINILRVQIRTNQKVYFAAYFPVLIFVLLIKICMRLALLI